MLLVRPCRVRRRWSNRQLGRQGTYYRRLLALLLRHFDGQCLFSFSFDKIKLFRRPGKLRTVAWWRHAGAGLSFGIRGRRRMALRRCWRVEQILRRCERGLLEFPRRRLHQFRVPEPYEIADVSPHLSSIADPSRAQDPCELQQVLVRMPILVCGLISFLRIPSQIRVTHGRCVSETLVIRGHSQVVKQSWRNRRMHAAALGHCPGKAAAHKSNSLISNQCATFADTLRTASTALRGRHDPSKKTILNRLQTNLASWSVK